jgi:hypothetical protein
MRNLTITVDEEVVRWARIRAAESGQSVSHLIGEMLRKRMAEERTYESAMEDFLSRRAVKLKKTGGYAAREEFHERARVR